MNILKSQFYRDKLGHPYLNITTDIPGHEGIVYTITEGTRFSIQILDLVERRDIFKYQTLTESDFLTAFRRDPGFIPFLKTAESLIRPDCTDNAPAPASQKKSLWNGIKKPVN